MQQDLFPREREAMLTNKAISPKSALLAFHPFLDDQNLIRVGGRISNAPIPTQSGSTRLSSRHILSPRSLCGTRMPGHCTAVRNSLATLRREIWMLRAKYREVNSESLRRVYPTKGSFLHLAHGKSPSGARLSAHSRLSALRTGLRGTDRS